MEELKNFELGPKPTFTLKQRDHFCKIFGISPEQQVQLEQEIYETELGQIANIHLLEQDFSNLINFSY